MFTGKLKRKLATVDPYQLIPAPLFQHRVNDSENVEIHVPKFKNEAFGKLFLSKKSKPYHVIELDETGSRVYSRFNGERNIKEILELVRTDGKEPIEQLEERCFSFIQQLFNQKYITFKQLQT